MNETFRGKIPKMKLVVVGDIFIFPLSETFW